MKKTRLKDTLLYFGISLLLMLLINRLTYEGGRFLSKGSIHHNLSFAADSLFPFLPWTIVIYIGCGIFWLLIYFLVSRQKRKEADRFFSAVDLGHIICFFFFVFFPTTINRPRVTGYGICNELMRILYRIDAPNNLFPSIHCFISWLCYVAVRGKKEFPLALRAAAFLWAIAVFVSTLTTRQHVLVDVAGGILLAEAVYWLSGHSWLRRPYSALVDRILRTVKA